MYNYRFVFPFVAGIFVFAGNLSWGQGTSGRCEEGSIPRCTIEYYNDGSRSEIYTDSEGGGRVEWRFTGQEQLLTNVFVYPGQGLTMELELNPNTSRPQASLTYTKEGRLLAWRTFDEETQTWTEVPISSTSHTLERFVDPGRRLLKTVSCPRKDEQRCTLTRHQDGSSTERLFYPNGKLWEESIFKTSNRMDFEFASFDFWGRERVRKVYDRQSGNLKTAYWFDEPNKQILRYIYDLKSGKETATVIYNEDRVVLRWEKAAPGGLVAEAVVFNGDGFPQKRLVYDASRLKEETAYQRQGLPLSRLHYNMQREVQLKELYDQNGNLKHVECLSGPCKQAGYSIRPASPAQSICQSSPEEPQCQPKTAVEEENTHTPMPDSN
ncbi:hypothetical protein [Candidatus Avelusimicrobium aviculae]|uniref:hypothetical protein n=1 Tax=Candidatus Avelusimicrobium aviculae TaxID=3416206 RepID=UPI003D151F9E